MNLQSIAESGNNITPINENFEVLDWATCYAKNPATTSALTWGYYGGRWGGNLIAAGTLSLTGEGSPTPTNYIVVNRGTGAISVSTSATNWNDTANYARVYKVPTTASGIIADQVEDHRNGPNGVLSVPPSSIPASLTIAASDETTALTTGDGKVTFRMPHAMTLSAVRASLTTAAAGSPTVTVTVNIKENGVDILSTPLTIDHGEKTSTTAATPAVISDTSLADDAEITIDIDAAGGGAAGLKVTLIGTRA